MAEQCERHAATFHNEQVRQILLEVATKWRALGDDLKVCAACPFSAPS
jgi:hypothetical protein